VLETKEVLDKEKINQARTVADCHLGKAPD
jgi:hypothetical protein